MDNKAQTAIVDSSWFLKGRFTSYAHIKFKEKKHNFISLDRCRKIHLCILKESKIIAAATVTDGTTNDSRMFPGLIRDIVSEGWEIGAVIADKAYGGRPNYMLCEELGIPLAFLDFKRNARARHPRSNLYRRMWHLKKDNLKAWREQYRFRSLIEATNSVLKRKFRNYVASFREPAMDNELLLRALVYNLTLLSRLLFFRDL